MSRFNWSHSYPPRNVLVGTCNCTEVEGLVTVKGEFTLDVGKMKTSEHTRMINSIRRGYTLSKTGPARRILDMLYSDPTRFGLDPFPPIGYVGKQHAEVIIPVQWAENGVEITPQNEQFNKAKDMVDSLKATAFMMDVDVTDQYATFTYTKHKCGYYRLVIAATGKSRVRGSQLESVTNKLTSMLSKWGEIIYPKRKQLSEFIRSKPKLIISFDTGDNNV